MLKTSTDFAKALAQVDKMFRTMPRQAIKAALNEVPKRYAPLVRKPIESSPQSNCQLSRVCSNAYSSGKTTIPKRLNSLYTALHSGRFP